jgi:hypothetical protein
MTMMILFGFFAFLFSPNFVSQKTVGDVCHPEA